MNHITRSKSNLYQCYVPVSRLASRNFIPLKLSFFANVIKAACSIDASANFTMCFGTAIALNGYPLRRKPQCRRKQTVSDQYFIYKSWRSLISSAMFADGSTNLLSKSGPSRSTLRLLQSCRWFGK